MKKIMTVKKLLIAMVFSVAVLGGYQAYEQVSHTNVDSFLLENVEALASSSDTDKDKFAYKIDKDDCKIPYTERDLEIAKNSGYSYKSSRRWIDYTDATQLFTTGGKYRLGDDVTCNDIFKGLGKK